MYAVEKIELEAGQLISPKVQQKNLKRRDTRDTRETEDEQFV
jgi:hypothetical protein